MRNKVFEHQLGGVVDLPLLVPSFSSKGFRYFTEKTKTGKITLSETTTALESLAGFLEESFLLSAFDIHHGHFREYKTSLSNSALIFYDSGAYELSDEFDSSEPKITSVRDLDFEKSDYLSVLKDTYSSHAEYPLVVANFDWETRQKPFIEQIHAARKLFADFPKWSSNLILKPQTPRGSVVRIRDVVPIIEELREFDVIGVTEKELGKNLKDRLQRLAKLRLALSDHGISNPIHVWGGLDPLVTPLYYFAGADIFDGVSWLRYAYHNGVAVNRESSPILSGSITTPYDHVVALTRHQNLVVLQGLSMSLRSFANSPTPNFKFFASQAKPLKKAYENMSTLIPRIKDLR